MLLLNMNSI